MLNCFPGQTGAECLPGQGETSMGSFQDGVVWVCVAAAATWLIYRGLRAARGSRPLGCGGCNQCPSSKSQPQDAFVSLEQLQRTAEKSS